MGVGRVRSPRQLHIPVRTGGVFYFPWHGHQIELRREGPTAFIVLVSPPNSWRTQQILNKSGGTMDFHNIFLTYKCTMMARMKKHK